LEKRFGQSKSGNYAQTGRVKSWINGHPDRGSQAAQKLGSPINEMLATFRTDNISSIILTAPLSDDHPESPEPGFASALAAPWPYHHFSLVAAGRNWVGSYG
jgi:hypothetical protein